MKYLKYINILLLLILLNNKLIAQDFRVDYEDVTCFDKYTKPVIGILKIAGDNNIEEQIYNSLKFDNGWKGKFKIFSYNSFKMNMDALKLISLNPNDFEVLNTIRKDKDFMIDVVLTGQENSNGEFEISLIDTETGNSIFWCEYKNSDKSTPNADLIKLFTEKKKSIYKEKVKFGSLWAQGQEYRTVKIGDQEWLADNLSVTRFSNGDLIPEAKSDYEWKTAGNNKQPAWCYYANHSGNGAKYGILYNWYAVNDSKGLVPEGWHIPTKTEFETLQKFLHNNSKDLIADGDGTNLTGFSAFFSGYRDIKGSFSNLGSNASFWSSTEFTNTYSYYFDIYYYDNMLYFYFDNKGLGLSVRCIKNN